MLYLWVLSPADFHSFGARPRSPGWPWTHNPSASASRKLLMTSWQYLVCYILLYFKNCCSHSLYHLLLFIFTWENKHCLSGLLILLISWCSFQLVIKQQQKPKDLALVSWLGFKASRPEFDPWAPLKGGKRNQFHRPVQRGCECPSPHIYPTHYTNKNNT